MKVLRTLALTVFVLSCSFAFADTLTISNTGVGTYGSADPHYSLSSAVSSTAYIGTFGSPWVTAPSGSQWITPGANPRTSYDPTTAGIYNYSTTFDFTGLDKNTATISFDAASDNGVQFFLNGNAISVGTCCSFGSLTHMQFAVGGTWSQYLVSGTNTLTFRVTNNPQATGNPTGLLVAHATGSADPILPSQVPEPASLVLFGSGMSALAAVIRRRTRR